MSKMYGAPENKVFKCQFSSALYSCYFSSYLTRFTAVFSNFALRASVQMFIPVKKKKKKSVINTNRALYLSFVHD